MKIIQLALVLERPENEQATIKWAQSNQLVVKENNPYYVDVSGTPDLIAKAFQFDLTLRHDGAWFPLADPVKPDGVHAVVGLDARPKGRRPSTHRADHDKNGFYPNDIREAYNIPDEFTGEGETIGILQFNSGYSQDSLDVFTMETGLGVSNNPAVVSVDGGHNDSGTSDVDREATLDIEWAYAIAPQAKIVVYEAPNGSSNGAFALHLLHSLSAAITDPNHHLSVLSISYGVAESSMRKDDLLGWEKLMNAAILKGIPVCVSSGDSGAYGKNVPNKPKTRSVDGPSSCPSALAVGGTTLKMKNGEVVSEEAWTNTHGNGATGGGISEVFSIPSYQKKNGIAGDMRGIPDVAANADSDSGYFIVFDGAPGVIGGTSAATPVWAGIIAGIKQQYKKEKLPLLNQLHDKLYALKGQGFRDIVQGNNSNNGVVGFEAGPGWDYCTGWGTPDVEKLASLLKPQEAAAQRPNHIS